MQIAFATLARRLPEPRLAIAGCTEVQRRIRHLRHEEASRYVVTTSELRFDEQVP